MKAVSGDDFLELLNETLGNPEAIQNIHEARLDRLRLTATGGAGPEEEPPEVTTWLGRLRLLHGVPFHYLVPEPRMLPPESIRLFYLDPNWLHYLEDGAWSVGRTGEPELAHDEALAGTVLRQAAQEALSLRRRLLGGAVNPAMTAAPARVTGLLLRSSAVRDWPGLEVAAFDAAGARLEPLRIAELGMTTLFALFAGELERVRLSKPAETLHFGVGRDFKKGLRGPDGRPLPERSVAVPLRDPERSVLDVAGLAERLQRELGQERFTSAGFALQMVEPVEQVSFEKQAPKADEGGEPEGVLADGAAWQEALGEELARAQLWGNPELNFTLNNKDDRPFLYITDDPSLNELSLVVANNTGVTLKLKGGTPVPQDAADGPSSFYLYLDALLAREDIDRIQLTGAARDGWNLARFQRENRYGLALCPKVDQEFPPEANRALTLTLGHITTRRPQTFTQWVLLYPRRIIGFSRERERTLRMFLDLPPTTPRDLRLAGGPVGSSQLVIERPGQPVPPNSLHLKLINPSDKPVADSPGRDAPVFVLRFHTSPESTPEAVTTDGAAAAIAVETPSPYWKVIPHDQEKPPYWELKPLKPTILDGKEEVSFCCQNIVTSFDPGTAFLYVDHRNVPGYRNGGYTWLVTKVEPAPTILYFRQKGGAAEVPWGQQVTLEWGAYGAGRTRLLIRDHESEQPLAGTSSFVVRRSETGCSLLCGEGGAQVRKDVTIRGRLDPVQGLRRVYFASRGALRYWDPQTGLESAIHIPRTPELLSSIVRMGSELFWSNRSRECRVLRADLEGRNLRTFFAPSGTPRATIASCCGVSLAPKTYLCIFFINREQGFLSSRLSTGLSFFEVAQEQRNMCMEREVPEPVPPLARVHASSATRAAFVVLGGRIGKISVRQARHLEAAVAELATLGRVSGRIRGEAERDVTQTLLAHEGANSVVDLCADESRQRLYWLDAETRSLCSANFELGDVRRLCPAHGGRDFAGMAVEPTTGDVLWIDGENGQKTLRRWSPAQDRGWTLAVLSGELNEGGLAILGEE